MFYPISAEDKNKSEPSKDTLIFSKGYNKSQVSSQKEFGENIKILFKVFPLALPEFVVKCLLIVPRAVALVGTLQPLCVHNVLISSKQMRGNVN